MTQARPIDALKAHLAKAKTRDEEDPCLHLGVENGAFVPWEPIAGRTKGQELVRVLDAAFKGLGMLPPPSLRAEVEASGAMELEDGLLQLALAEDADAELPVNDVFVRLTAPKVELKLYDEMVLEAQKKAFKAHRSPGIGFVHIGRTPLHGLVWKRRWDDPMLIASTDLADGPEPFWLAYDEVARDRVETDRGVPTVLPLALNFQAVVGLHLAGLYPLLRAEQKGFDKSVRSLKGAQIGDTRGALEWSLKALEQAALAAQNRTDVRAPNVYPQRKHAVVASLRTIRGAEFFIADAGLQKWLDSTFVGAHLNDAKKTAAIMKGVSKARAPARPTEVLQAVIAGVAGGFYKSAEPCFTEGTVAEAADHLHGSGVPVLVPDEFGDVDNFSSLADGAAHVLDRAKRIRAAL